MADGRRLTRSQFKAINEYKDSSPPPKKKPKSGDVKQSKTSKTESRECKDTKPDKNQKKKASSQLKAQRSHQEEREKLYQVETKEIFNIRTQDDATFCDVYSLCMLDSRDILIADCRNQVLKQINGETYTLRNTLKLCSSPNSVCKVGETEAVVALSNSSIQFVSVQDMLVPTRTLKMDHYCLGICVMSENIFITDGGNRNLFIHDMDGNMLKKVHGENIFSWNRFMAESDDGKAIYVTDRDTGLIKMDRNGDVIWKCCKDSLKGAFGLCTDGLGNVFVSGFTSGNVVQITCDGKYLGEVVPSSICIPKTSAVCFDRQKSKLFVYQNSCDEIHAYSLK